MDPASPAPVGAPPAPSHEGSQGVEVGELEAGGGVLVVVRPLLRGRIHQVAAVVSIPAGLLLVLASDSPLDRVAALVYAVSLTALFVASSTYHLMSKVGDRMRLWLRKLDHSMIFVLMGGCYTPLCLVALPQPLGVIMLTAVWVSVIFGVVLKMVGLHPTRASIGSWLYIVLGWALVVALPWLVPAVGWMGMALLLAGGLLYTVGAVTLATQRPNPSPRVFGYHEVWHAMGVTAAAFHFGLIWTIVT